VSEEVGAGVRRVLLQTLGLNAAVAAGKIGVGWMSGSQAMVADGFHSLVDASNNVVGLVVATFAHRPPDEGHPYGHKKFESAAAILIGLALLGLSYDLLVTALRHLQEPELPNVTALNWIVMGVTLLVNMAVARYEAREGRRLGSSYLTADAAHTQADVYVTLGVAASFAGSRAGIAIADPLVAAGIALFIAWMGLQVLKASFDALTDRAALSASDLASLVATVAGVRACGDIRTRGTDGHVYVDLVVHLEGTISLNAAHAVADRIEEVLKQKHPEIVDVVVHTEPA
jgi:cation diffusion facilitator family transporter